MVRPESPELELLVQMGAPRVDARPGHPAIRRALRLPIPEQVPRRVPRNRMAPRPMPRHIDAAVRDELYQRRPQPAQEDDVVQIADPEWWDNRAG